MICVADDNFKNRDDYRLMQITGLDMSSENCKYIDKSYSLTPIQQETGLGNSYAKVYFTNKGYFILKDNKNIPDHVYKLEPRITGFNFDNITYDGDFLYSKVLDIPLCIYVETIINDIDMPTGEYQVMLQTLYIRDYNIITYLCNQLDSLNIAYIQDSNHIYLKATQDNLKLLDVEFLSSNEEVITPEHRFNTAFIKHTECIKALTNKIS